MVQAERGRLRAALSAYDWVIALVAVISFLLMRGALTEWATLACAAALVAVGSLFLLRRGQVPFLLGGLVLVGAALSGAELRVAILLLVLAGVISAAWHLASEKAQAEPVFIGLAAFGVVAAFVFLTRSPSAVSVLSHPLAGGVPVVLPVAAAVLLGAYFLLRSGLKPAWSTVAASILALVGGMAASPIEGAEGALTWLIIPLAVPLLGGVLASGRRWSVLRAIAGAAIIAACLRWAQALNAPALALLLVALLLGFGAAFDPVKEGSFREAALALKASPKRTAGGALYCVALIAVLWLGARTSLFHIPKYQAMVMALTGDVSVKPAGEDEWQPAQWRMLLKEGDAIKTGAESAAILKFGDGSVVKVSPGSDLKIKTYREEKGVFARRLRLALGRIWVRARHIIGGYFEVETPCAVAGIRGTDFSVAAEPDQTYVSCWRGATAVTAKNWTVVVKAGHETRVKRGRKPMRPQPMSREEFERWQRELPALDAPIPENLWEASLQANALSDDFNDNQLDVGVWMVVESDPGVRVEESGGELRITGRRAHPAPLFETGVSTLPFTQGAVEASVSVRLVRGEGRAEIRLAGERKSAGFGFQEGSGYLLVLYGKRPTIVARTAPVGDESVTPHRLTLHYDSSTKTARAFLDGTPAGSCSVDLGRSIRIALLYVTRRPADRIECAFDNFSSNVVLSSAEPVATLVAKVMDSLADKNPTTLVALKPLSKRGRDEIRLAEVKTPAPQLMSAPIFAPASARLKLSRKGDHWAVAKKDAGAPPEGDYIFRFVLGAGQPTVRWMTYSEPQFGPPQIIGVRRLKGGLLQVSWIPAPEAKEYWVDVLDAQTGKVLARRRLAQGSNTATLTPPLSKGQRVVVAVRAYDSAPPVPRREVASDLVRLADSYASPGGAYVVALKAPGLESRAACSLTRLMVW